MTPFREVKRRVQINEESLRVSKLEAPSTPTTNPTSDQTNSINNNAEQGASSQGSSTSCGFLTTSTPAFAPATNLHSSSPIFNTPSLRKAFNKSVSPITRSAQRMPRCMQVRLLPRVGHQHEQLQLHSGLALVSVD